MTVTPKIVADLMSAEPATLEENDELELADFDRKALIYDIEKLKRPVSALQGRIDYVKKINDRWRTSSSTS